MTSSKLNRENVVKTWACSGIEDLYLGFYISKKFPWRDAFFYHQGLEKICEAYLLGTKASEYESLQEHEIKIKIDEIARDKKKMGHNLKEMINTLVSCGVLDKGILTKEYGDLNYAGGGKITGENCIEILERAYIECRYPVPTSISEKYPLSKNRRMWWDPIASSEPGEFVYDVGLEIIKRIEQDFNMTIPRDKFSTGEDDKYWIRFRRTFFKDNI